jgi:hypothetical protein
MPCGYPQRHEFSAPLAQLTIEPGEGGFNSMTVRKATHPHVIDGSSVVVIHARYASDAIVQTK